MDKRELIINFMKENDISKGDLIDFINGKLDLPSNKEEIIEIELPEEPFNKNKAIQLLKEYLDCREELIKNNEDNKENNEENEDNNKEYNKKIVEFNKKMIEKIEKIKKASEELDNYIKSYYYKCDKGYYFYDYYLLDKSKTFNFVKSIDISYGKETYNKHFNTTREFKLINKSDKPFIFYIELNDNKQYYFNKYWLNKTQKSINDIKYNIIKMMSEYLDTYESKTRQQVFCLSKLRKEYIIKFDDINKDEFEIEIRKYFKVVYDTRNKQYAIKIKYNDLKNIIDSITRDDSY